MTLMDEILSAVHYAEKTGHAPSRLVVQSIDAPKQNTNESEQIKTPRRIRPPRTQKIETENPDDDGT